MDWTGGRLQHVKKHRWRVAKQKKPSTNRARPALQPRPTARSPIRICQDRDASPAEPSYHRSSVDRQARQRRLDEFDAVAPMVCKLDSLRPRTGRRVDALDSEAASRSVRAPLCKLPPTTLQSFSRRSQPPARAGVGHGASGKDRPHDDAAVQENHPHTPADRLAVRRQDLLGRASWLSGPGLLQPVAFQLALREAQAREHGRTARRRHVEPAELAQLGRARQDRGRASLATSSMDISFRSGSRIHGASLSKTRASEASEGLAALTQSGSSVMLLDETENARVRTEVRGEMADWMEWDGAGVAHARCVGDEVMWVHGSEDRRRASRGFVRVAHGLETPGKDTDEDLQAYVASLRSVVPQLSEGSGLEVGSVSDAVTASEDLSESPVLGSAFSLELQLQQAASLPDDIAELSLRRYKPLGYGGCGGHGQEQGSYPQSRTHSDDQQPYSAEVPSELFGFESPCHYYSDILDEEPERDCTLTDQTPGELGELEVTPISHTSVARALPHINRSSADNRTDTLSAAATRPHTYEGVESEYGDMPSIDVSLIAQLSRAASSICEVEDHSPAQSPVGQLLQRADDIPSVDTRVQYIGGSMSNNPTSAAQDSSPLRTIFHRPPRFVGSHNAAETIILGDSQYGPRPWRAVKATSTPSHTAFSGRRLAGELESDIESALSQ